MAGYPKRRDNIKKLTAWKEAQSRRTSDQLNAALDRFESGTFINVPKGQKLTRLAFAKEAGVAPDTPFSRYRAGHIKEGEYRFPEAVVRFELLRQGSSSKDRKVTAREKEKALKQTIKYLDARLEAARSVVNAQDIKIEELELRNIELEELLCQANAEKEALEKEIRILRRRQLRLK